MARRTNSRLGQRTHDRQRGQDRTAKADSVTLRIRHPQVFGDQRPARAGQQYDETEGVPEQDSDNLGQRDHSDIIPWPGSLPQPRSNLPNSIFAEDRYSHVTAIGCDGVNPGLLGMKKVISEDAMRRALSATPEAEALLGWTGIWSRA